MLEDFDAFSTYFQNLIEKPIGILRTADSGPSTAPIFHCSSMLFLSQALPKLIQQPFSLRINPFRLDVMATPH